MASWLHCTDLGSDTDDEDYKPDEDEKVAATLSEEEDNGDDGGRVTKKAGKKAAAKRGLDPGRDDEAEREDKRMREEFSKEKEERKELLEKAKADDLWADFKKDVGTKKANRPSTAGSGLGAIGGTAKNSKTSSAAKGSGGGGGGSSKPRSIVSSIFDSIDDQAKATDDKGKGDAAPVAEAEKDSGDGQDKVTITRTFDFAGEDVSVSKEVDRDSSEAKKFLKEREKAAEESSRRAGGGLAGLVGAIAGKKKKMGTLDKSKLDWDRFVDAEGIKEELQTHNRGKDGFVEKQQFMERADLRRFELEKEAREKTRKPLNR